MEFVELLAEVPDSTSAVRRRKRERARALARLRREEKRAELKSRESWASYYEALGKAQMDKGDYPAAIESFQQAMEMIPARTLLREHIAFCHICLEEFESAKDLLIDILRDDPEEAPAYVSLAAYYMRADPDEAMVKKLLTRSLEIDPGCSAAHSTLGGIAQDEGRHEDALVHYAAVLRDSPDCAWTHYRWVMLYLEGNSYAKASEAFDQMLETADCSDPEDAEMLAKLKLSFSMESGSRTR